MYPLALNIANVKPKSESPKMSKMFLSKASSLIICSNTQNKIKTLVNTDKKKTIFCKQMSMRVVQTKKLSHLIIKIEKKFTKDHKLKRIRILVNIYQR